MSGASDQCVINASWLCFYAQAIASSAKLLRELPKADVLVDRRSSQPGAIHDVFDADESVAHDELLLFVHEMRLVSIF